MDLIKSQLDELKVDVSELLEGQGTTWERNVSSESYERSELIIKAITPAPEAQARFLQLLTHMTEKVTIQEENIALATYTREFTSKLSEIELVNGAIIWKVSVFNQKMKDAQAGKRTMICSQPFHLEGLHYKAYFQLYPNGKGIGKDSHISLFFVIMKGEFDDQLQWPFSYRVTLKLINQTRSTDIIHTFQPDPVMKPESDDGPGIGCLQFVSHSELKKRGYVEDDTLFIQCEVHRIQD